MPTDLITPAEIDPLLWRNFTALAAPTQSALIAAASRAIERACDRVIGQSTRHEDHATGRQDSFYLRQYPVQAVLAVRAGFRTVLSVANVDTAVQRATVSYTTSGPPLDLTPTGIVLASTASGITTATPLTFAAYPTLGGLATAINAVSGWHAVLSPVSPPDGGWANFPATDLLPDAMPQPARVPATTSATQAAGARLKMFTRDIAAHCDINNDSRVGRVTMLEALPDGYRYPDRMSSGGGFGLGRLGGFGGSGIGTAGNYAPAGDVFWAADPLIGVVRVEYVAGYATPDVPGDLKQATIMAAKFLFEATAKTGRFQSETLDGYSYTLATLGGLALPDNVMAMCMPHRRMELV